MLIKINKLHTFDYYIDENMPKHFSDKIIL